MLRLYFLVLVVILECSTSVWCRVLPRRYQHTVSVTRQADGDSWSVGSDRECLLYYLRAQPVTGINGISRCRCPQEYPHFYGETETGIYGCYQNEKIISECNQSGQAITNIETIDQYHYFRNNSFGEDVDVSYCKMFRPFTDKLHIWNGNEWIVPSFMQDIPMKYRYFTIYSLRRYLRTQRDYKQIFGRLFKMKVSCYQSFEKKNLCVVAKAAGSNPHTIKNLVISPTIADRTTTIATPQSPSPSISTIDTTPSSSTPQRPTLSSTTTKAAASSTAYPSFSSSTITSSSALALSTEPTTTSPSPTSPKTKSSSTTQPKSTDTTKSSSITHSTSTSTTTTSKPNTKTGLALSESTPIKTRTTTTTTTTTAPSTTITSPTSTITTTQSTTITTPPTKSTTTTTTTTATKSTSTESTTKTANTVTHSVKIFNMFKTLLSTTMQLPSTTTTISTTPTTTTVITTTRQWEKAFNPRQPILRKTIHNNEMKIVSGQNEEEFNVLMIALGIGLATLFLILIMVGIGLCQKFKQRQEHSYSTKVTSVRKTAEVHPNQYNTVQKVSPQNFVNPESIYAELDLNEVTESSYCTLQKIQSSARTQLPSSANSPAIYHHRYHPRSDPLYMETEPYGDEETYSEIPYQIVPQYFQTCPGS